MKTGKAAAIAIAATLIVPATVAAKTTIYAGTITGGGEIALTVVSNKKSKPKGILEIRGVQFPVVCEQSGPQTANAKIPVVIRVSRSGTFAFERTDEFGNRSAIDGKFSGGKAKNLTGELLYANHFAAEGSLPEEDCTSAVVAFQAKKGAPDIVVPGTQPRGI